MVWQPTPVGTMHPYHGMDEFAASPTPVELVHEPGPTTTNPGVIPSELSMLLSIPVSGTMSGDGTPVVQTMPIASTMTMMTAHNAVNFASNSFMFPSPSVPTSGGGFSFTPLTTSYTPFQFPSPAYRAPVPVSGSSALPRLSAWNCHEPAVLTGGRIPADICQVTHSSCTTLPKPCSFVRPTRVRCFKRRANIIDDRDIPHAKVHINEEKMTACMQQLHLDNNNLNWHPNLEDRYPRRRARTLQEIENRLKEEDEDEDEEAEMELVKSKAKGLKTLELSKTLKLGLHTKEILPKAVIEGLQKPCMQLVLWKPPGDMICNVVKEVTKQGTDTGGMEVEVGTNTTGTSVTSLPDLCTGHKGTPAIWCPASSANAVTVPTPSPTPGGNISMPLEICDIDDDEMEL